MIRAILAWLLPKGRASYDHEKETPANGWRECVCGWCVPPHATRCVACEREVSR